MLLHRPTSTNDEWKQKKKKNKGQWIILISTKETTAHLTVPHLPKSEWKGLDRKMGKMEKQKKGKGGLHTKKDYWNVLHHSYNEGKKRVEKPSGTNLYRKVHSSLTFWYKFEPVWRAKDPIIHHSLCLRRCANLPVSNDRTN